MEPPGPFNSASQRPSLMDLQLASDTIQIGSVRTRSSSTYITDSSAAATAKPGAADPGGSATLPAHYKLKAFISHKGPSVHSGHYVAHIRFGDDWVLFNDEKVVKADAESVKDLKRLAYLYIFERV